MAVTIQQAALNALRTWLEAELPDVTLLSEWPVEPQLPEKAISIIPAGAAIDEQIDLRSVAYVSLNPTTGLYTWQVKARRQPFQLDLWARYPFVRDDVEARLDVALHRGEFYTLNKPFGARFRDGVLLALADEWTGYADFTFDPPRRNNDSDAAQKAEWRSTQSGETAVILTIQAEVPKLLLVGLRMALGEGELGTGPAYNIDWTVADA